MKSIFTLLVGLLIVRAGSCQQNPLSEEKPDPFCLMIKRIYSLDALCFDACSSIKNVFETDTVSSRAHVVVKKKGTTVEILQIMPMEGTQELLFCHDSAWVVDHRSEKMTCIGNCLNDMTYSGLSRHFSFTLFSVDTTICNSEPYWNVISQEKDFTTISLDISNVSRDVSEIKAEFTVYNSGYLPYKTLQESVYLRMDKLFQEQVFTAYTFPTPEDIKTPEYFSQYSKNLDVIRQRDSIPADLDTLSREDIILKPLFFNDLTGHAVQLPDSGLIFLDFWYVGCAPCMKSAPVIESLSKTYQGRIHFYSINETDQDTAKIKRFIERTGISFPVLFNKGEKLAAKISGSSAYPQFVLIDASTGKILWRFTGYTDTLEEIITEALNRFL